ncbi:hypothetical protein HanLR1_Chr09g0343611 [Helianthus annuus]|nr:hypothetical protein HanLR1_Chr09g0343611 [Helianthus annuus]
MPRIRIVNYNCTSSKEMYDNNFFFFFFFLLINLYFIPHEKGNYKAMAGSRARIYGLLKSIKAYVMLHQYK